MNMHLVGMWYLTMAFLIPEASHVNRKWIVDGQVWEKEVLPAK
jgi:hypothetical protein